MQLERVGLVIALALGSDTALAPVASQRLATAKMTLPALPLATPTQRELAPLSHFPVAAELAVDRLVAAAIARGDVPGAVVLVGRKDGVLFERTYGFAELEPEAVPLRKDAVFDLASVTKAVATATSIALLVERGVLRYDDRVSRFVAAFEVPDKRELTIRQLLTHTSGLPPVIPLPAFEKGHDAALRAIAGTRLGSAAGERHVYSDLGFVVLAKVIERAANQPLAAFARDNLFAPLGLGATGFELSPDLVRRAVPTERVAGKMLKGRVHDPRARALGQTGHAGLFSSAHDLARFARMLANQGTLDGVRVLGPGTLGAMIADQRVPGARVGLGWDLPDEPAAFSARSFGHEGFTGTSLWIDPVRDLFVIFLSSRLHPHGRGKAAPLAQAIRVIAADAVLHLDSNPDRGVGTGIDVLRAEGFERLRGEKLALVTNDGARARDGERTTDVLFKATGVQLVALLSPEHGLAGTQNGVIVDGTDTRTRLPVESLFGEHSQPSAEVMAQVDALVVDLQDAGARFYTYSSTLLSVMRTAAAHHKRVVVLDRPNPIGGDLVEGPVSDADPERRSFVDPFPLPVRHGMTLGELARLYRSELGMDLDLDVVDVVGWDRKQRWRETSLRWFPPSPNLRSPEQALLYPGIALFETTNLSVGRGTPHPFERLGAPWLVPERLLGVESPGVKLRATTFVPDSGPFHGEVCRGLAIEVVDASAVRPVSLALGLAQALRAQFPEWESQKLAILLGNRELFRAFERGAPVAELQEMTRPGLERFLVLRSRHLAY